MGLTSGPIASGISSIPQHLATNTRECKKTVDVNSHQTTLRTLHEGPDTAEQLLGRHVARSSPCTSSVLDEEEEEERIALRWLTSTRREPLDLYRDILRATRFCMWTDARGVPWRDVLRENARKEFEEARFGKDTTRLLIGGKDTVDSALEKLAEKQRRILDGSGNDRRSSPF